MALKDLIAQKASLTEGAIEEIVSEYVRYDPEAKEIAFTPKAADLPNRAKVLIYLVALQGWPFVSAEAVPMEAKPGPIADHLGIPGGTLRPILKELKERHIVAERSGRYFVRSVSLPSIRAELGPDSNNATRPHRKARRNSQIKPDRNTRESSDDRTRSGRQPTKKKSGGLAARFSKWIVDGFFDKSKTLADVHARFHKEGIIVPQTSVSPYLLAAVRAGKLTRDETEVNKRRVWSYTTVVPK